jgi:hypothetical protein
VEKLDANTAIDAITKDMCLREDAKNAERETSSATMKSMLGKRLDKPEKIELLIGYLKMKTDERDWHGVCDAANDIRVLEGK